MNNVKIFRVTEMLMCYFIVCERESGSERDREIEREREREREGRE
jgi:hypothetical protein